MQSACKVRLICSALAMHDLRSPPDLVVCPGCRPALRACQLNSCLCCLQSLPCAALPTGVQQALAEAALQLHQWMLHLQKAGTISASCIATDSYCAKPILFKKLLSICKPHLNVTMRTSTACAQNAMVLSV